MPQLAQRAWRRIDRVPRDQFHELAASVLPTLTVDQLADLYRSSSNLLDSCNKERLRHASVVSALLELLGGQAILPKHALENTPGYQTARTGDGDLVLQTVFTDEH